MKMEGSNSKADFEDKKTPLFSQVIRFRHVT